MPENNLNTQIKVKVQEDTDKKVSKFKQARDLERKIKVQEDSHQSFKKELNPGETSGQDTDIFGVSGSIGIVLALGLTLALINDFSDLVFWQKVSLVSQTLDITTLILVLFMVIFASRSYFTSVFVIIFVFLLEILPVIGVLPLWTIGMAIWYMSNRKKN